MLGSDNGRQRNRPGISREGRTEPGTVVTLESVFSWRITFLQGLHPLRIIVQKKQSFNCHASVTSTVAEQGCLTPTAGWVLSNLQSSSHSKLNKKET
jgi:hypothetical protein